MSATELLGELEKQQVEWREIRRLHADLIRQLDITGAQISMRHAAVATPCHSSLSSFSPYGSPTRSISPAAARELGSAWRERCAEMHLSAAKPAYKIDPSRLQSPWKRRHPVDSGSETPEEETEEDAAQLGSDMEMLHRDLEAEQELRNMDQITQHVFRASLALTLMLMTWHLSEFRYPEG
eukprot:TRINITY_DN19215_c0_g1_i2.p1 TRINITY_DN19215_c0_g1~~TRINITY_DN19215_c0_g1_i2.p1  ORF type:complete len:181 (-),score=44.49 TRINITY_DN19215_c0_g1_i2:167-709(-)